MVSHRPEQIQIIQQIQNKLLFVFQPALFTLALLAEECVTIN